MYFNYFLGDRGSVHCAVQITTLMKLKIRC